MAAAAILMLAACAKDNDRETLATSSKIFIRIAQQDIDGKINYSKIVQAIVE
ncbi:hypothetical protein LWM68_08630 [Niabella sp. W65]|nr:hypothetical protein [Niabella sp. W65]MCH7362829.1 hypothetical protein [Niabella sp. W65]ULT38783.1 hypothetical protein KRR40_27315 [Niabella sp. I65]